MRQVRSIPNLFGDHPALVRKIFDRRDERFGIATGREFVMAAFSCQNGPASAYASSIISAAIISLTVAVVIVTTPARALRQAVLWDEVANFNAVAHVRY